MSHYIVQTATAKMPASCWGRYIRVAVLEVDDGVRHVKAISTHARGAIRIVMTWEKCHAGKTKRSASAKAIAEAEALAKKLNDEMPRQRLRQQVALANGLDPKDDAAIDAIIEQANNSSTNRENES